MVVVGDQILVVPGDKGAVVVIRDGSGARIGLFTDERSGDPGVGASSLFLKVGATIPVRIAASAVGVGGDAS